MKKIIVILSIPTIFILALLSFKTNYRLTNFDIDFNPYNIGDTLLFNSNKGEKDTLIIYSIKKRVLTEKCYSFFSCICSKLTTDSWEGFYVNTHKINENSIGKTLLKIRAGPDGRKTISFEIYINNARWYGDSESLEQIKNINLITFDNGMQTFSDVQVIKSNSKEYLERDNFIEKIYWSKSNGLIGIDKLNGEKWVVTKK